MTDEEIIRELKSIEEQYRNKPVPTFEVNISSMARSCRQHIEQLAKENVELKISNNALTIQYEQDISELKSQIEKMKNCSNCKHNVYNCGERYCKYDWNRENDCRNKNQWELVK